jgi:hypothetical protein
MSRSGSSSGFVAGLLSDDLASVDLAELILERAEGVPAMIIEGSASNDDDDNPAEHQAGTDERASTLAG